MNLKADIKTKEFLVGLAVAGVVFWLMTKTILKKPDKVEQPKITPENISIAIEAYSLALENNAPQADLNDLNKQLEKDYGLRVYQDRGTGAIVATDLSGKEVKKV